MKHSIRPIFIWSRKSSNLNPDNAQYLQTWRNNNFNPILGQFPHHRIQNLMNTFQTMSDRLRQLICRVGKLSGKTFRVNPLGAEILIQSTYTLSLHCTYTHTCIHISKPQIRASFNWQSLPRDVTAICGRIFNQLCSCCGNNNGFSDAKQWRHFRFEFCLARVWFWRIIDTTTKRCFVHKLVLNLIYVIRSYNIA